MLPKTPSFRLDGKRAFVAGGSRGIGLGCSVALAEAGAHVVLAARTAVQVDETVAAMAAAGLSAEGVALDVTDLDAVAAAFAGVPFDVMVNSAGVAHHAPGLEATPDQYDKTFDVNVRSAYFLAQAAAQGMVKLGGGSIIQISSQMGHVGGIDRTVYSASKHAVEGMTKSMAIEWGKLNIRVNNICPTFIRTPLTEVTFNNPERYAWLMDKIKLPRAGEVTDIMGAVQFLASDASAMVTGTSLLIDGGWIAD